MLFSDFRDINIGLSLPLHQIYLEHPWLQLASTESYATTTDGSCQCGPSLLLKFVSLWFLVLSILVVAEFSLQPPPPSHHPSFFRRICLHDIRITFAQLTRPLLSLEKMSFLFFFYSTFFVCIFIYWSSSLLRFDSFFPFTHLTIWDFFLKNFLKKKFIL